MGELTTAAEQAHQQQNPQTKTVLDLVYEQKPAIDRALPKHIDVDRFTRIVLTEVRRNPRLLQAEGRSLLAAVMLSAQLGLELGPLGQAYLVPFKNNKKGGIIEITFMVGYQGMIDLARRTGQVSYIQAYAVHENDHFQYQFGLHPDIEHKPAEGDRGALTHVYSVVHYRDGGFNFEVLTVNDVDKFKNRSRAKDNGPWVTDYEAMAKKTAIRRLWPWLPKSPEMVRVARVDESSPMDITEDIAGSLPILAGAEELDDPNVTDAEIVDDDTDEAEDPNADIAQMDEQARWDELTEMLAETPDTGTKAKLVGLADRLDALMASVNLAVPSTPAELSEGASKDDVLAAVAEHWQAAKESYSSGPVLVGEGGE